MKSSTDLIWVNPRIKFELSTWENRLWGDFDLNVELLMCRIIAGGSEIIGSQSFSMLYIFVLYSFYRIRYS